MPVCLALGRSVIISQKGREVILPTLLSEHLLEVLLTYDLSCPSDFLLSTILSEHLFGSICKLTVLGRKQVIMACSNFRKKNTFLISGMTFTTCHWPLVLEELLVFLA